MRVRLSDAARKAVEDLVSESVEARYGARKEESNPYWDDFAERLLSWKDTGVTGQTLVDIAKELRVSARILDCTGRVVLEHNPAVKSHHLRPICATLHGQHVYLYDGENAIRSLTQKHSSTIANRNIIGISFRI